ncbi:TetR/AcrR family transcriptional regulator [Diaphorobacter sp. HDW4A]|uniref:TetR/AcrR family transcriptional regulator n=1 Tax=Diaphorobacter sp. HDW4A TaxID=2714924 RepID=UPI0014097336|nr:TetR/AcrR family transcriptional regulator [Diaphorobacter sp. HDW4A]QIL80572.1 TetR/AcrR family transcriptional regulator [Diaphorobacter sp. HDW4A]
MPRTAASAAKPPLTASTAVRPTRQKTLSDSRRQHVLGAARTVFFELGLEGTSIREIAKQAGYTPGAIYSYFASKEEVYAALLGESLERLNAAVQATLAPSAPKAEKRLEAAARAFYQFYADNPRDLDLGFYLFQGMQPRGLTAELNERLNQRLRDSLAPVETALQDLGMDAACALVEVTALFAHVVGLLVLSHTGRIRMFRQQSSDLFAAYLQQLATRAATAVR